MAYRYVNFYVARPPTQERVVKAQNATPARNHTAPKPHCPLVAGSSFPSFRASGDGIFRPRLRDPRYPLNCGARRIPGYPSPWFKGNFIVLMDDVGDFGANLGAMDGVFFEELVVDSVRPLLWCWQRHRWATSWR
jgi:hypothetical protein